MTSRGRGLRAWAGAALLAAGAVGGLTSSCNFVVNTDIEQCKTDADCAAKGGAFATATCKEHVCTVEPCKSNQECINRNAGAPSICRRPDNVCVQLTATDCAEVFPQEALTEDPTIVIGFMGPLTGADASSGIPTWEGVKLALQGIETQAGGIPMRGSTERRRLAALACDDANDPVAVAKHLAVKVGVPAIVGPNFSGVSLQVATKVTIPAGTLLISPSATSPALTDLQDNGLFWRTAPSDALQAIPLAKLVSDLEAQIRCPVPPASPPPGCLEDTALLRIAMTVKGDAYGKGLADASIKKIVFNGKPASENGSNFLRIDYPDPNDNHDFGADVKQVTDFKPHIIVAIGTTEAVNDVIVPVEAAWSTATSGAPKPFYAISDGGRIDELLAAVDKDAGLRTRLYGTFPGRTTAQYNEFVQSFKGFLKHDPGSYASNAYDAANLLAYALVSGSEAVPTGAGVNEGLKHTIGGQKIAADASSLNTGFKELLVAGGKIDYDGVSGPLDFDPNTGEAPADIDVWCVVVDAGKNIFKSSGQYFDSTKNAVVGSKTNCN
jgi:branched-chain amino acid transport system substrate-binding protein